MLLVRGLGFIVAGVLFWLLYFDLKDRLRPEPRRRLLQAVLLGLPAALLALGTYSILERLGVRLAPGESRAGVLVYCLAVIGPIEEGAKFLVARTVAFRWPEFDERIDGLIYAACVAIGFAAIENVLYMQFLPWPMQAVRSIVSPLTHSLFAALWGFGVARARFDARSPAARFLWQAGTLVASMAAHGLYDYFLLAGDHPWLSAGVSVVLWVFLIVYARRLLPPRRSA